MPTLTINGKSVEVPRGATLLDAARTLGIEIPTLCFLDGYEANTSCMLCVVELGGSGRLVASCATPAADGMEVFTDSETVLASRKTVLELLFSHHAGDCVAPCRVACPASLDIARMCRLIGAGDSAGADTLAREALVLPEVLGCVCPAPCEKACRRRFHDAAVAIPHLHRAVADAAVSLPAAPETGKSVVVIGAGPAGLAAAVFLRRFGHRCVLRDENDRVGGMVRRGIPAGRLPADLLDRDIARALATGIEFRGGESVPASAETLERLLEDYDAVILATGSADDPGVWGLEAGKPGLTVDRATGATSRKGIFAAGNSVRDTRHAAVRAVASARIAAEGVHRFLTGAAGADPTPVNCTLGSLREGELARFLETASPAPRIMPDDSREIPDPSAPPEEAGRCLHCDCRAAENCRLRDYATAYGAGISRWKDKRPPFEHELSHPEIIYEPGKCIACGLCIRVTEAAGERLGTTFLGRGIAVRVAPPLREDLAAALTTSAAACVAACPTGALAFRRD